MIFVDKEKAIQILENAIKTDTYLHKNIFIDAVESIIKSTKSDQETIKNLQEQLEKEHEHFKNYEKRSIHWNR